MWYIPVQIGQVQWYQPRIDKKSFYFQVAVKKSESELDHLVWSIHKPWTTRPLLSMHVRMGDKACEMKVVGFQHYMQLADHMRKRFPDLNSIWLSTEMQTLH